MELLFLEIDFPRIECLLEIHSACWLFLVLIELLISICFTIQL